MLEPEKREAGLEAYRKSDRDDVLVSPSLTTGVDLPYDLLRFQILPKLPFPDQRDPVVAAQKGTELGKRLGLMDTAVTLGQAYGRIMRADDDGGYTYLLDANWNWARGAMRPYMAPWFMEAIV